MREVMHQLYPVNGSEGPWYITLRKDYPWLINRLWTDSKEENWLFPYDTAWIADR